MEKSVSFDQLKELLKEDRTIRRFVNSRPIEREELERIVELVRYCASGRNVQALRYLIINDKEECEKVFPLLKWAGYYTDWDGPSPEERPVAYLVQCLDTTFGPNPLCDDGLQLQTLTLGARTRGIGGCIIKSFNAPGLKQIFNLPDNIDARYVLALGYPAETPLLVDMPVDGDFKYFRRAEDGQHCVPKRSLAELLIGK